MAQPKQIQLQQLQNSNKDIMLLQANIQKALTQLQAAGGMPYTPGSAASWKDPAPTTMQDALDRMAALLKTLNGGNPVP